MGFMMRSFPGDMINPAEKAGKGRIDMKKVLLVFLSLCLLLCGMAFAEEAPVEDGDPAAGECVIRLWNRNGKDCSYIRFSMWQGEMMRGYVLSCPNEGEDFYRCPVSMDQPDAAEGTKPLRIELSMGFSEESPEDAIISAMMGNPAPEEFCCEMTADLAAGEFADYELVMDEAGGYILTQINRS